jgi:DNA integrity scanning protein DisA with diadenylate cyclase activity
MILDPLKGHPARKKSVFDKNLRETLKELAQLDGGFIISNDGVALAATRFFNASTEGIELPLGLGSRHMAAASITRQTRAAGVVVSESSVVRLFEKGALVTEIIPEVWYMQRHWSEHGETMLPQ